MNVPLSGAIELPDGCWVRGRGLRHSPPGGPSPAFGLYLGTRWLRRHHQPQMLWQQEWVTWPDFLIPLDRHHAVSAITDLHRRALDSQAVEVACGGGVGRTGTVIACLAVLAGLSPEQAISWTRARYHPRAVETPWQRHWIRAFSAPTARHRRRSRCDGGSGRTGSP